MDDSIRKQLTPGARVCVTQQIPHRDKTWVDKIAGVVLEYSQKPTGSWFAHSKGDKLWLDRLKLQLPDGELMTLILDEYTAVEIVEPAAPAASA
ncbi:MAG TPA: hypothetical protein VK986_18015 [Tepidisphaeraceae bacterium]|nr:hypothetical protein [Tepidisphaeraceae bacterium]